MRNPLFALVLTGLGAMGGPDARLVDAITSSTGANPSALPTRLSQTGLYTDIRANPRSVTEAIVPFEVNAALWSDASHKERFVTVPPGAAITPTDSDGYDFPDRTVMVKNFLIDTVIGDPGSRILVETRFMVARKTAFGTEWHGISYAWRRDQSDADLVDPMEGRDAVLPVTAGGARKGKRWRYPSASDCMQCHTGRGSLGFITPQLNRPAKGDPSVNQLQDLAAKGILKANTLASNPRVKRWAALTDTAASLEVRARSYLAANCSHCHGNGAFAGPIHSFDYFNDQMKTVFDPKDAYAYGPYIGQPSTGGPTVPQMAYAGFPDSSFLIKRMLSRGTFEDVNMAQMPPLATYQPDSAAVKVVADWICSLGNKAPGSCNLPLVPKADFWASGIHGHGRLGPPSAYRIQARLREGRLIITASGRDLPDAGTLALVDIRGRSIPLRRIRRGEWALAGPGKPAPGIYGLVLSGRTLTLHRLVVPGR